MKIVLVKCVSMFAAALVSLSAWAKAQPPIEAYGMLPTSRSVAISPDGLLAADIHVIDGRDILMETDLTTGKRVALVEVTGIKANGVNYVGEDYLVLRASKTTRQFGYRGEFEFTTAFVYDRRSGKVRQLLSRTEGLYPAQSGLGRIVTILDDGEHALMPAYSGQYADPSYDLYRVNLKTGRGHAPVRGRHSTIDWFAASDGTIFAREDMRNKSDVYRVLSKASGKWEVIFEAKSSRPALNIVGISPDKSALIVAGQAEDHDYETLRKISLADCSFSEPLLSKNKREIGAVLVDQSRVVYAVRYAGMYPESDSPDSAHSWR